jgi:hypothetical protein
MLSTRLVLACFAAGFAASCVHRRSSSLCAYDESLKSSIATEFSRDSGTIAGRVVSIALEALTGSRVTLSPSGQHIDTGADGSFRFEHLAPGSYEIAVDRPGYGHVQQQVRLLASGGARVTVTLGASVICLTDRVPSHGRRPVLLSLTLLSNDR